MSLTILAVGAHMDDVEFGIGGILIQAVAAGHRVVAVVMTSDYTSWGPTVGREEQCLQDQLALAARFGYEKRFMGYRYHQVTPDLETKQRLARLSLELRPDIAFVHNTQDHWPDHVASGLAAKDALLFAHGLSGDLAAPQCRRVFAFCAGPGQTIAFSPDFYADVTDVMVEYVELLQGTDSCLTGMPSEALVSYEVRECWSGRVMQATSHGWMRLVQCAQWADESRVGQYAIGLETLWGPRDGRPLW